MKTNQQQTKLEFTMGNQEEKSIAEEIQDNLIKKVNELEKREIKFPDYTPQFEELRGIITEKAVQYPAEQIQRQLEDLQSKISVIPKVIPVRHYLDLKSKGLLSGVAILLLSSAIAVGLSVTMLIENQKLRASADKFFMIRQSHSSIALWADTTYQADPKEAMAEADSLEAAAANLAAAQREANEKHQASELARQKVEALQRNSSQVKKRSHR
jgi:hypothetical protein